MKYKVIERFNDRQNKNETYVENEEYPKKDAPLVSKERIQHLIKRGYIIQEKKEVKDNGKKV